MTPQRALRDYLPLVPLQLAIIRSQEAALMARYVSRLPRPVLEIGCSDGAFGEVLFGGKRGAIDVGIDIDTEAIALGSSMKTYRKMVAADVRALPFRNRSFGAVLSNQSLEHVDGIDRALGEIARVIKPEGRFIFLVPTEFLDDYWLTSAIPKALGLRRFAAFLHEKRNKLFAHYNLLPVSVWRKKLRKIGFTIISYEYTGSKLRYGISELFQPARLPQYLIWKFLHKRILAPRWLVLPIAMALEAMVERQENSKPHQGPTMLIIAKREGEGT